MKLSLVLTGVVAICCVLQIGAAEEAPEAKIFEKRNATAPAPAPPGGPLSGVTNLLNPVVDLLTSLLGGLLGPTGKKTVDLIDLEKMLPVIVNQAVGQVAASVPAMTKQSMDTITAQAFDKILAKFIEMTAQFKTEQPREDYGRPRITVLNGGRDDDVGGRFVPIVEGVGGGAGGFYPVGGGGGAGGVYPLGGGDLSGSSVLLSLLGPLLAKAFAPTPPAPTPPAPTVAQPTFPSPGAKIFQLPSGFLDRLLNTGDDYGRSDYGRSDYGRGDYGSVNYGRVSYPGLLRYPTSLPSLPSLPWSYPTVPRIPYPSIRFVRPDTTGTGDEEEGYDPLARFRIP